MSQDGHDEPMAPTEDLAPGLLEPGQVLGDRYQIHSLLGRGGMGEVWRAFDLKLRVEVALKALREDLFKDTKRRELLRQEVRAAREVVSPNVCRIFDLIEAEGRELVSMEFVDGGTLLEVLQERGPLELKEAQDIASQFLAGLEAIHRAGLVHRDVKPENIMITRAGRVVLMDFGLARGPDSGAGTVSGTPAYMAPEQAAGLKVDARADVYSAGVVLAEMVSPEGVKSFESRQSVWEGMRSEPAKVPDTPWAPVLKKAVAKEPAQRYKSAHTLTRALEDVTLRVEGAEDLNPYPGLACFTEQDAEYFFGREAEVEAMWAKLERPHLLALIGPSGAGKSSFIRAGLIPSRPPGWAVVVCTPGNSPALSLSRALAAELAGDAEAVDLLLRFDDPDVAVEVFNRWRGVHQQALLIVDQFEELFTQNAPEVQERIADLLGRLALEADVHVLLSMRDDFLFQCHRFGSLTPLFYSMTPLGPPAGAALRRALVQPATTCGYRFEDDELVEEMLAEVEGERGSLPLLAFTLAQLWERRDRDTGLLTHRAYQDIGGVGGALAQHAERTIDRLGAERIPVVRELFRNLVTPEGTRAVRGWDELLSIFGERRAAEARVRAGINPAPTTTRDAGGDTRVLAIGKTVGAGFTPACDDAEEALHALIDARLLTSYEVQEEGAESTRRVEIIHESLLTGWPRLVRWQTQDADGAQLRDELRQAAWAWDERGRPDDRLWAGTAYREYRVWQERYPGGLTDVEQAFATAMTSLAGRTRRRRRAAVAALLTIAAVVAAVTTALWRRSVLLERRAEAQKLVAVGTLQLEDYPTAALAHATQSLELADTEEARFLALRALWKGPTAFVVNEDSANDAFFSPDGSWFVQSPNFARLGLRIISRNGVQRVVEATEAAGGYTLMGVFGGLEDLFISFGLAGGMTTTGTLGLWSAPESRLLGLARTIDEPDGRLWTAAGLTSATDPPRALFAIGEGSLVTVHALHTDGRSESLGSMRMTHAIGKGASVCSPRASGEWFGVADGNEIAVVRVSDQGLSKPEPLGRHDGHLLPFCSADPLGRCFVTLSRSGEIRLWDVSGDRRHATIVGPPNPVDTGFPVITRDGSHLVVMSMPQARVADVWVWSLDDLSPRLLRRLDRVDVGRSYSVNPIGPLLAMSGPLPASRLWWLGGPAAAEPIMLRHGPVNQINSVPEFSPDGRWLATTDSGGLVFWPLARRYPAVIRHKVTDWTGGMEFGPEGRFLVTAEGGTVSYLPLEGPAPASGRILLEAPMRLGDVALSPDGKLFAASSMSEGVWVGRIDGGTPHHLASRSIFLGFSPDGRRLGMSYGRILPLDDILEEVPPSGGAAGARVVEVKTVSDDVQSVFTRFAADGRLLTGTREGVAAWNLDTGDHEMLVQRDARIFTATADGRRLLVMDGGGDGGLTQDSLGPPEFFDLDAGTSTTLTTHWPRVWSMALNSKGTIAVTGDRNGVIRVGPVTGEEPHLLLGHDEGDIQHVAVDPTGSWIASSSQDGTLRLWPMPDLSKPPLHTLPREQLIARLKTLTNLRLVRDNVSGTGWKITHEAFLGWETLPDW